jgi:hypothetical protein
MRYALLLFALLFVNLTYGQTIVGADIFLTSDTDDNTTAKYGLTHWGKDTDLGVKYIRTEYRQEDGHALALATNNREGNVWTMGYAGVGQLNGKNYFVGDISALAFVNKHLNVSAGVFGDRLENLESLENDITFYGAYVNADVYNDYGGFNFLAKQARFDGTVRRDTLAVKGHVNLIDGFHAYVNHSNMTNTENSVFFWSPDKFVRTDIGLGMRKRFQPVTLMARYDIGRTDDQSTKSNVSSWFFGFESDSSRPTFISVRVGQDLNAFNYKFSYGLVEFRLTL